MQEDFLHYVWQYSLFDLNDLRLTSGQPIDILKPGDPNSDSGPDFFNARLVLDNATWAGNVEIHWYASEWNRHGHQHDPAYNNVVLHVVYEEDETVYNHRGEIMPTLQLKGRIDPRLIHRYQGFLSGRRWVPCAHLVHEVIPALTYPFLHRLMAEKLEEKSIYILREWERNQRDWEQTFYEFLARNFGFSVNAVPFQLLASGLPLRILARENHQLLQVEALLIGQSGLLEGEWKDDYPQRLQKEYAHLRRKYSLHPVNPALWKLSRMRPANFPIIRLAQLALLIHRSRNLFSALTELESLEDVYAFFDITPDGYWDEHYTPDKLTTVRKKSLGRASADLLIINTVVPFLFVYGRYRDDEAMQQRAVDFLEKIPPENNRIIANWEVLGLKAYHALDSQALLHLKKRYCSAKKCLTCTIGNAILKKA